MHFVAALDSVPEMRAILALFEGVATGAADGYARMADKPAATLLHLGSGLGNGLANLHNARKGNSPIVNIVGDHATYHTQYDAQLQSDIETVARAPARRPRVARAGARRGGEDRGGHRHKAAGRGLPDADRAGRGRAARRAAGISGRAGVRPDGGPEAPDPGRLEGARLVLRLPRQEELPGARRLPGARARVA